MVSATTRVPFGCLNFRLRGLNHDLLDDHGLHHRLTGDLFLHDHGLQHGLTGDLFLYDHGLQHGLTGDLFLYDHRLHNCFTGDLFFNNHSLNFGDDLRFSLAATCRNGYRCHAQ